MDTISTVVLSPAVDVDLTTLAIVKDELQLSPTDTSNDQWLGRAISQVSTLIARYCNRQFWPERLLETQQIQQDPYPYQTPGGVSPLQLTRWPLIAVNSVQQVYPIKVEQNLVVNRDYSVAPAGGYLNRLNPFTGVAVVWESLPTVIDYVCGFGSLIVEPTTVPASPGPYTYTVENAETFSFDNGVSYAGDGGIAFTKVTGTPTLAATYAVDDGGDYTFAPADQGAVIDVGYASASIPLDLVDACLRVITQRWWQRDRDPMLMSIDQPNLGSKRFWVPAGNSGQPGGLPPEITSLLAPYRVPVIA